MKLLNKKEAKLEDLENYQSIYTIENEKNKSEAKQPLDKEISMDVKYELNSLSQQWKG